MKSITIRNVPEDVHRRLRVRAAHNGRSLEAELRALLGAIVRAKPAQPRPESKSQQQADPLQLTGMDIAADAAAALGKVRRILEKEAS